MTATGTEWSYLFAAICFILALKALSSPRTARGGNLLGVLGMAAAIAFTFADQPVGRYWIIAGGMALGTVIAVPAARLVKMTAMPQMVAAFNGVGGAAAAVVSVTEYLHDVPGATGHLTMVEIVFPIIIGCLSFTGSALAFAKLQELMTGRPVTYRAQQPVNALLGAAIVGLGVSVVVTPHLGLVLALVFVSLVLGFAFVLPVGGADTPVLISMLNSFTGLAVAADGFLLSNFVLIVGGILVGASGALLTRMMATAMGRSLANILFGAFGKVVETAEGGEAGERPVRSGTVADVAIMLAYSQTVIIIPGYGLAVAQAQHAVRQLADALSERGVHVLYAIHPVAGRMPGHMNVLLAEANVPYEQLVEMDSINPEFPQCDVALVVGANDVVNPAARDSPGSPIYGMPILEADQAKSVVFMKRSMAPGFAGIQNELMFDPKTTMLFGDARDTLMKLVAAVKEA